MHLTFGRSGSYGSPGNQVCDKLGYDGVQELRSRRKPPIAEITKQLPGLSKALIDVEAVVDIWIVDKPLPAYGGSGLFKINPHQDAQIFFVLMASSDEVCRIFSGRLGVMNRAGTSNDEASIVFATDNRLRLFSRLSHRL